MQTQRSTAPSSSEQPDAHPLDVQGARDQPRGSREHPLQGLRLVHRQAGEAEPAASKALAGMLDARRHRTASEHDRASDSTDRLLDCFLAPVSLTWRVR